MSIILPNLKHSFISPIPVPVRVPVPAFPYARRDRSMRLVFYLVSSFGFFLLLSMRLFL